MIYTIHLYHFNRSVTKESPIRDIEEYLMRIELIKKA